MISLDRAVTSCDHWLRYAPEINLISDCKGLLSLLDYSLCEVRNRRLQNILERVQGYNSKVEHIRSGKNRVCNWLWNLVSIKSYLPFIKSQFYGN